MSFVLCYSGLRIFLINLHEYFSIMKILTRAIFTKNSFPLSVVRVLSLECLFIDTDIYQFFYNLISVFPHAFIVSNIEILKREAHTH